MASPGAAQLLDADRSVLAVIDLQSRLMPAIADGDAAVQRAAILVESARTLGVPALVTEQYPKGLGPTVSEIAERLPNAAPVIEKLTFSAARNRDFGAALADLRTTGRDQIVVCGAETHVCVMQTVADLKASDAEVFLVADACGSRAPADKEVALARLAQLGVPCVTTEMVVFEWLEIAGTPAFKTLSKLIK